MCQNHCPHVSSAKKPTHGTCVIANAAAKFDTRPKKHFTQNEYVRRKFPRLAEFRKAEHIKQLERSEKPRSSKLIRNLVTEHTDANESVSEILEKWRTCGEVRWRTVDGRHIRYKNFCKHPTCPRCNGWHKWKEKKRAVAIFKELTGGHWDRNDFSLLTVNDKKVSLGTYLDKRRDKMRNKLKYRFNQKLNGLVVLGEFELAHGRYELDCGFFAKLHFHGIVWHPHESRETIAKELKKSISQRQRCSDQTYWQR